MVAPAAALMPVLEPNRTFTTPAARTPSISSPGHFGRNELIDYHEEGGGAQKETAGNNPVRIELREEVRPHYIRLGVLPEVAAGNGCNTEPVTAGLIA